MLFFIKVLRSCLYKSDDQVNTQKYRNSTLIKKTTALYRIGIGDTHHFLDRIGSETKWDRCTPIF